METESVYNFCKETNNFCKETNNLLELNINRSFENYNNLSKHFEKAGNVIKMKGLLDNLVKICNDKDDNNIDYNINELENMKIYINSTVDSKIIFKETEILNDSIKSCIDVAIEMLKAKHEDYKLNKSTYD